jgi:hypothetical protein
LKDKFEQDAGECNRAIRRVFTGRQVLPGRGVNHAAARLSDDYVLQPHVRFGGEADIAQTPEIRRY